MSSLAERAYIALALQCEREVAVERQSNAALKKNIEMMSADIERAQSRIAALEHVGEEFQTYRQTYSAETFAQLQQENVKLLKNIEGLRDSLAEAQSLVTRYEALSRPPERRHASVATENVEPELPEQKETPPRPRKRPRQSSTVSKLSSDTPQPLSTQTGRNQSEVDWGDDIIESLGGELDDALDIARHVGLGADPMLYTGKWYKRAQIHAVLGGNRQSVISKNLKPDKGGRLGVQHIAMFAVISNPRVPTEPGANGEAFLGLTHEATIGTVGGISDIFEVFSDRSHQSSKDNVWKYMGTYRFTRAAPLTVREWKSLSDKVQESYATITRDRLHSGEDIPVIKKKYLSGEYKCPRLKLTCIGFHRTLQAHFGTAYKL